MQNPTTASYALLALLAVQPWSGYELTKQARRSLRYVWPSSEAHLYREQRRLVRLGWARVEKERAGRRSRNRYTITPAGRSALRAWLRTEPSGPVVQMEGLLRLFFADHGRVEDLVRSLDATAREAREAIDDMLGFVDEYLETGGPFPERLHLVAMAQDLFTRTLGEIEAFCSVASSQVAQWDTTVGLGLTDETRDRLQKIRDRYA
ncbi:MAG: PadR family transcriptional regulator [Actinomycetota bacterium]